MLRVPAQATDLKEMYYDRLPKKIPKKGAHPVKVNEELLCKKSQRGMVKRVNRFRMFFSLFGQLLAAFCWPRAAQHA